MLLAIIAICSVSTASAKQVRTFEALNWQRLLPTADADEFGNQIKRRFDRGLACLEQGRISAGAWQGAGSANAIGL